VTSDDILAKYRKHPTATKQSADPNVTPGPGSTSAATADTVARNKEKVVEDETPVYDSNNLELCQAFLDAKKKLRLILSSVDLQVLIIFLSDIWKFAFGFADIVSEHNLAHCAPLCIRVV